MKLSWFAYLPKDEQDSRKSDVKIHEKAWDILKEVLEHKLEKLPIHPEYDSPSWAYHQAHRNGQIRMLEEVIGMLQIDKE